MQAIYRQPSQYLEAKAQLLLDNTSIVFDAFHLSHITEFDVRGRFEFTAGLRPARQLTNSEILQGIPQPGVSRSQHTHDTCTFTCQDMINLPS